MDIACDQIFAANFFQKLAWGQIILFMKIKMCMQRGPTKKRLSEDAMSFFPKYWNTEKF